MNRREMLQLSSLALMGCSFKYLPEKVMETAYDVLIIGGGPGGLSSALTLARGGRSVLVFDDGKPRNAPAAHMQNFPSQDGTPPAEFRRQVLEDLKKYKNVSFVNERVLELLPGFRAATATKEYQGKKIILAHGIKDVLPEIPGFKELWGKSIFHCPYCHGHEHRGEAMGVIGNSTYALHMAPLLKGLTQDLVWFSNGAEIENRELIEKNGIKIYDSPIKELRYSGETLEGVILDDGGVIKRKYLFGFFPRVLNSDLGTKLGCELNEDKIYKVTDTLQTSVSGVYAVGDIAQRMQSVLMASSSGQLAGAMVNFELLNEEFRK